MVDGFGGVGPRHWKGKAARTRTEELVTIIIENARAGRLKAPAGSALEVMAADTMDAPTAAKELLNLLRPIVAISTYVAFKQPFCMFRVCRTAVFYAQNTQTARKGGDNINSFMSWVGGKKALRDEIVLRFPLEFERYVEVFGGGGWVLFHKPPSQFEVYNDFNSNLANLFYCVRERPEELIAALEFVLNAREDFNVYWWNGSWNYFDTPAPAPANWNMITSSGAAAGDANLKVYSYANWWTRSPGNDTSSAYCVAIDGSGGSGSTSFPFALRPALWVRADILH